MYSMYVSMYVHRMCACMYICAQERGPHKTQVFQYSCQHSCPLMFPSNFNQGVPHAPGYCYHFTMKDLQGSRYVCTNAWMHMYILVVAYFMKPSLLTDPCQRTSTTTTRWSTSIDSKVASAVVTELQLNPASSHRRRRRTSRLSDSCANRKTTWRGEEQCRL